MFKKKAINIMKTRVFSDFEILGGKFMNKNFKSKLVAGLMTTAMLFSSAAAFAPVHAADTYQPKTFSFNKYLVYDEHFTQSPTATFNFSIAPGTPQEKGDDTLEIKAGPTTGATIGDEKGNVSFNANEAFDEVQTGDGITLPSGTKYSKQSVNVDLSKVEFPGPGIYRYKIIETETAPFQVADATKALDVYVVTDEANTNKLQIQNYVLHDDETGTYSLNKENRTYALSGIQNKTDAKTDGFVNTLKSHNLAFEKKTTGDQREPNHVFTFKLEFTSLPKTTYTVNASQTADDTTKAITSVTTDDNGKATIENIKMKAGNRFAVYGLSDGATYTVTETDKNGYKLTGIEFPTSIDGIDTKNGGSTLSVNDDGAVNDGALTGNADFSFVNDKSGIIPTGIIFAVAPFAVGAVVLAAFIIVKMRRTAKQ